MTGIQETQTLLVRFLISIFVLQHISAHLLEQTFDKFERWMGSNGKLYVLGHERRAVLREIPLDRNPHMQKLMKKHYSRLYTRSQW